MPNVSFVLKAPSSNEPTLIFLIYRFEGQMLKYSTGHKIDPKFWNSDKQRVKEQKRFHQAFEFNNYLNNIEHSVNNLYRKLINDKISPSPEKLREGLNSILFKNIIVKQNNLITFIEDIIATTTKKENTKKNYTQTLNKLKEFKNSTGYDLAFENINLTFYDEFMRFCIRKNYGVNTIGAFIKNIKVFMNEALDRKLTSNTEFKNKKFKTLEQESDSIYLTMGELEKLTDLDLVKNSRLDLVRDMFLIAAYTGLRYSDLMRLNDKNIIDKGTKIKISTQKTGNVVIIPLHKTVKQILLKHNGFPQYKITNQKMNEYVKELAKEAEINDTVLITETKGGVKKSEKISKCELITVHTARRSFATNAFIMNIPTISIMKITGHRNEKSFMKYIKISQEENANKLINHPFFN